MALENILKRIQEDSRKKAAEIKARSERERGEVIKRAEKEMEDLRKRNETRASKAAEEEKKRRLSLKRLALKNRLLALKHEIIDEVFEEAFEKIRSLPEKEYLQLFSKLLEEHAEPGRGGILVSEKDRARIDSGFISGITSKLSADAEEYDYSLSDESADIEGGFILKTGSITLDCSFEALFSAARAELEKQAGDILFKDG